MKLWPIKTPPLVVKRGRCTACHRVSIVRAGNNKTWWCWRCDVFFSRQIVYEMNMVKRKAEEIMHIAANLLGDRP